MPRKGPSTRARLGLAAAFAVLALALAGIGAYSTFTSSATGSQSIATGTVDLALGATGAETNRLSIGASAVAPGDTIQRSVDLIDEGSLPLASITLTTTATTSSALDTDTTNGLQMVIDSCSVPWSESGTAPAYTYTCSGSTTSVLGSQAIIASNISLSNLAALNPGGTDHLRVTLTLPTTAGNSFQGLSSTVQYSFTGVQRTATND